MAVRRAGLIGSLALASILVTGASAAGGSPLVADGAAPAGQGDDSAPTAALSPWTGGMDLYREGTFSTQRTWRWCTAAVLQIIRNIERGEADRSRKRQQRYFSYMRAHDRYAIPLADGVDPAGWAAGMRKWVDPSYRVVAKGSFAGALRAAVTSLRTTDLPVAIAVARGLHAWVLTGFRATADPATTSHFKVRSVRIVGPLWGLQSRAYGYDMKPDKRLTRDQLKRFFTAWHYPRVRMTWEGRWVSIQPAGR